MRVSKVLGLMAVVSTGTLAHAADMTADRAYYELKAPKITVQEVSLDGASLSNMNRARELADTLTAPGASVDGPTTGIEELDTAEVILDKILAIGRKVWAVVEANKPVVSFTNQTASALPQGVQSWQQLSGWQTPRAFVYRVNYENLYGISVVDFSYRVTYTPAGNVNGRGRYLSNVTIVPNSLDVSWGYTFNANASIVNTVNTGSASEPVAGMELLLTWSIDTVLKHNQSTTSYFVRGDGQFTDLTSGR